MKLVEFLDVLAVGMPYTVGAWEGQAWLTYYDGKNPVLIPDQYLEREIIRIYSRERRPETRYCCELKAGLGILIEGSENGIY